MGFTLQHISNKSGTKLFLSCNCHCSTMNQSSFKCFATQNGKSLCVQMKWYHVCMQPTYHKAYVSHITIATFIIILINDHMCDIHTYAWFFSM